MKNKLHQSLTIFMAVLVLLSSTGVGFIEHQCLMRGKSVQFVKRENAASCAKKVVSSCCARSKALKSPQGSYFKKTDCCKENQKFEKVDVLTSTSQLLLKMMKASADNFLWTTHSFSFLQVEWISPAYPLSRSELSFTSRLHGKSMLFFIQSFLI